MTDSAPPGDSIALAHPRNVVRRSPQVDIVVPVMTRQRDVALSLVRLHKFLTDQFPFTAHVAIACAVGDDRSWRAARALAATFPEMTAMRVGVQGRSAALRRVWSQSPSDVLAYLDIDLCIDLNALIALVEPLLSGQADVAIGTRLRPGATLQTAPRREVTSCGYSLLVQAGLGTGFADVQCGFKAITRAAAQQLVPQTSHRSWFFDSELLTLARQVGLRIHEIPVNHASGHRSRRWRPNRRRSQRSTRNAA
jgi:hypothetical protein